MNGIRREHLREALHSALRELRYEGDVLPFAFGEGSLTILAQRRGATPLESFLQIEVDDPLATSCYRVRFVDGRLRPTGERLRRKDLELLTRVWGLAFA